MEHSCENCKYAENCSIDCFWCSHQKVITNNDLTCHFTPKQPEVKEHPTNSKWKWHPACDCDKEEDCCDCIFTDIRASEMPCVDCHKSNCNNRYCYFQPNFEVEPRVKVTTQTWEDKYRIEQSLKMEAQNTIDEQHAEILKLMAEVERLKNQVIVEKERADDWINDFNNSLDKCNAKEIEIKKLKTEKRESNIELYKEKKEINRKYQEKCRQLSELKAKMGELLK